MRFYMTLQNNFIIAQSFNVRGAVIKRHAFNGEININNASINKDDKIILTKIVKSKNKIYFYLLFNQYKLSYFC
jgi:hypothetical protein